MSFSLKGIQMNNIVKSVEIKFSKESDLVKGKIEILESASLLTRGPGGPERESAIYYAIFRE